MESKPKFDEQEKAEKSAHLAWSELGAFKRGLQKAANATKVAVGDLANAAASANSNVTEKEKAAAFRSQLLIDTKTAMKQFTVKLQESQGLKCSADGALLGVLEQMLLHAIKNSRPTSIFKKDPPNAQLLWEFLVSTSSAQIIGQVEREILGNSASWAQRCRIWMRLALDDADLFAAAVADRDAVSKHYGAEAFMFDSEMPEMAATMLRSVVTMANVARPGADGSAPAAIVVTSPFPSTDAASGASSATDAATNQDNAAANAGGRRAASADGERIPPSPVVHNDAPAAIASSVVVSSHKKKKKHKHKHKKTKSDANQDVIDAAKAELLKTLGLDDGVAILSGTSPSKTPSGFSIPTSASSVAGAESLATSRHHAEKHAEEESAPAQAGTASASATAAATTSITATATTSPTASVVADTDAPPVPGEKKDAVGASAADLFEQPSLQQPAASPTTDEGTQEEPSQELLQTTLSLAAAAAATESPAPSLQPPPVLLASAPPALPTAAESTADGNAPAEDVEAADYFPATLAPMDAPADPEPSPMQRQVSEDTAAILNAQDGILAGKAGRAHRMAALLGGLDDHLDSAETETVQITRTISANVDSPRGSPATLRAKNAAASFSATRKQQLDKVAQQRKQDETTAKEAALNEIMVKVGASRHQVWKTVELSEPDLLVDATPQNQQESDWHATFDVKVAGTTLTVSRTDKKTGWSQPLLLKATRRGAVPLPDLYADSAPGWKARSGRSTGPEGYKFGDFTRSTVKGGIEGGKKLVQGVTGGIASAFSKGVSVVSGGRLASSESTGGGGGGSSAPDHGNTDSGDDEFDDFELLTDGTDGTSGRDGVVSVLYDEQSSLEMLGKITILRPVVDLEADQMLECAHCKSKIPIIDPDNKTEFARRCEYDGKWYCAECHVNDEAVIPASILHHGSALPQLVSRRAKQFLGLVDNEPVLTLEMIEYEPTPGSGVEDEPPSAATAARLANLVKALKRISGVRTSLKSLKERMLKDPKVNPTELRQKLWPREHLWNDTSLWTVQDLREVALHLQTTKDSDEMVPLERKLRDLVIQFQKHISKQRGGKMGGIKKW